MAEIFYGPWTIRVHSAEAENRQQFSINGSDNDRVVAGTPGDSVLVSGDHWTVTMQWFDGIEFQPSRHRRSAIYDLQAGLTVTIAADDGPPDTADEDFNDLVLVLHCEDPEMNPIPPEGPLPDFTLPEDILVPGGSSSRGRDAGAPGSGRRKRGSAS